MFALGETLTDPPDAGDTVPTPLSMDTLVAFALDHDSVDDEPCAMLVGLAESDPVGSGLTVTAAWRVIDPPGPVIVAVYVVFALGETLTDPPDAGDTVPTPLLIETLVAFVLDHVSVDDEPWVILVGLADRDPVGKGMTVTAAWRVIDPPGPVIVAVYVVFALGETLTDPPEAGDTVPTPLSMDTLVAFALDHVSVDDEPCATLVGLAESDPVGSDGV